MSVNTLRIVVTVVSFFIFIGICVWAWSAKNKADFEDASKLPFDPVPDTELKKE